MKFLCAICAVACMIAVAGADPFKLKTEVQTVTDGPVNGTWMTSQYGILAAVSKNGKVEFPYVCAYKKGEENKLPYAMRWDLDTGELILQIPGEKMNQARFIPMKHIVALVDSSLKVREAGEYRSGDNDPPPK